MSFVPRPYQQEAVDAGIKFFNSKTKKNGIIIAPTGSGKSLIISLIAMGLEGKTIIFQPSLEILQQNFAKFISYGYRAAVYSASAGQKNIHDVTFATIGSVANKHHLFRDVKNIIIDECHLVSADAGMYNDFIESFAQGNKKGKEVIKVLGLTATPYRLTSGSGGAELRFITRSVPRIFNEVLYYIQNDLLFNNGYLAKLEYYSFDYVDRAQLQMNKSGTDFTEQSIKSLYNKIDMIGLTAKTANRLLAKRKNLLVFCSLISEAERVALKVPGSVVLTGKTEKSKRERILKQFKAGIIKCVINVGVLTTGFDYPELEAVLIARSTMSLAIYYQIVGRAMRPHKDKLSAWIVDLGGNISFFGKIETMRIQQTSTGLYYISNNGRQLTNIPFTKK